MPNVVTGVVSIQTLVFCFGIFFLVRVLRQLLENRAPSLRKNKLWNDLVLVLAPIVLGWAVAAVAVKYPYPPAFMSFSGRTFLGAVLGGFSGIAYRIMKLMVKKQFGVDVSISPPPEHGSTVAVVVIPPQDPTPPTPHNPPSNSPPPPDDGAR